MRPAQTPVGDADAIRRLAADVLQQSDYKMHSTENFARIIKWFLDILRAFFKMFDALYDFSPFVFFWIVAVMVLIVVALIVHIVYSLKTAMRGRRALQAYQENNVMADTLPESWDRRAWDAFAVEDYLPAIRFLLHASLLRLELARKATFRRGATNREYLRRYKNTGAYPHLAELVDITDSRWFGGVDCSRSDVEACFMAHQQIAQLVVDGNLSDNRS